MSKYIDEASCGNAKHPDGAWHTASTIPYSWKYWQRFKQWRNKKKWGCTCSAKQEETK